MGNEPISLVLLALNRHNGEVFHMTLLSHERYEAALQEVIGMGHVMLRNDREVVRVEIYKEEVKSGSRLVVLTRDDIPLDGGSPDQPEEPPAKGIASFLRRLRHWLLGLPGISPLSARDAPLSLTENLFS